MGESGSVIGVIICDRWVSSLLCFKTKNIQFFAFSVAYQWWLSDPLLIIIIIWTPKTHNFTRPQLKPGWTTSKTFWAKITQQQPYWERGGERESFIIYDVQAVPFLLWVKSGVYRNIGILERILRLAIRFDMGSYQVIQRP